MNSFPSVFFCSPVARVLWVMVSFIKDHVWTDHVMENAPGHCYVLPTNPVSLPKMLFSFGDAGDSNSTFSSLKNNANQLTKYTQNTARGVYG
ncbi:hypothetical protein TNIN_133351 [Trichonephila inaurata madagascariensis]|uniref:Uncharacterized protein n=1 Tax=Trichonephila inaurata madagascariensis TaxID=2747483 RepID=A0A8X6IC81_9ARAC|nr:hypothetical protein TNIN_133351 [Trichonephila inaurata madagascariensis]